MNKIDYITPKRYTDNQSYEAIATLIKKVNELIRRLNAHIISDSIKEKQK